MGLDPKLDNDQRVAIQGQTRTRSKGWYALGLFVTLVALYYFVRFIIENVTELPEIVLDGRVFTGFGFALVMYVAILSMGGWVWHLLMRGVGENVQARDTFSVFFVSQFAKYIPGNIGHHIGRVLLARNRGMSTPKVLLSMAIEVGLAVAASASLAVIALAGGDDVGVVDLQLPSAGELALLGFLVFLVPIFGAYLLANPPAWLIDRFFDRVQIHSPGWRILFFTFFLYLLNFLLTGGVIQLLAVSVFRSQGLPLLTLTGFFALGWVAGFLTPGAPAGLGVREAILVAFFTPTLGAGVAIGITLALRLVTSLGEAVVFGLGLVMRLRSGSGLLRSEPE
jgi:hypothetical protein